MINEYPIAHNGNKQPLCVEDITWCLERNYIKAKNEPDKMGLHFEENRYRINYNFNDFEIIPCLKEYKSLESEYYRNQFTKQPKKKLEL